MTPAEFGEAWERSEPWLVRALGYGGDTWDIADVLTEIHEGRAHFWANDTACAVTQFIYTPKVKALNYWLLAGDTPGLRLLLPQIEAWGIGHDCLVFMGEGRRGFEKRFARDDYAPTATLFVKDLRKALTGVVQ